MGKCIGHPWSFRGELRWLHIKSESALEKGAIALAWSTRIKRWFAQWTGEWLRSQGIGSRRMAEAVRSQILGVWWMRREDGGQREGVENKQLRAMMTCKSISPCLRVWATDVIVFHIFTNSASLPTFHHALQSGKAFSADVQCPFSSKKSVVVEHPGGQT